jgi:hypothetical protein
LAFVGLFDEQYFAQLSELVLVRKNDPSIEEAIRTDIEDDEAGLKYNDHP